MTLDPWGVDRDYVAQRIAAFEADVAAEYADALEMVSELEAEAAEQARLAAWYARLAELENAVEAADNGDQDVDIQARRDVEFDPDAGVCVGTLDGLTQGEQFVLYPVNERPLLRGVPARVVTADENGELSVPLHATSCYRIARVDDQQWLRFQAVGSEVKLPAFPRAEAVADE